MSGTGTVAVLGSAAVTGLIVVLLVAVAGTHLGRTRRTARDRQRREAVRPLLLALLDEDAATADLTAAPPVLDEMVLHLLPQLRGSDRRLLQQVLGDRGVVDRAAADLTARAAWRRGRAATLLGATASTAHAPALAALLRDPSADVRHAAARAMGKIGGAGSVAPLLDALDGERALPSGVAGMALLDVGIPALPALSDALLHGTAAARAVSARLLGLHGDLGSAPALLDALRDDEQPDAVRTAAGEALGRIGSPRATDALGRVLTSSLAPALRAAAAEALGRIGDPSATAALAAGVAAPEPVVAVACADALAALGPEGRSVLEALVDGHGRTSLLARGALDALDAAGGRGRRPEPVAAR